MENKKKTLLWVSNPSWWATGFGKHSRTLLKALWKTGKYRIIEYCASINELDLQLKRTPWETKGAWPNNPGLIRQLEIENRGDVINNISHGSYFIDKIIYDEKPDAICFCEDPWSFDSWVLDKPWHDHLPVLKWCPLDSLGLLPTFTERPHKWNNSLWVKAKFALKPLEDVGIKAELAPGLMPLNEFYPLPDNERAEVRKLVGIDDDTIVFGFVFRNQLRKLVVTLLEAFKIFQERNPKVKSKLLLHTNFNEKPEHSWPIPAAIKSLKLDNESILTTYKCSNCNKTAVIPYRGQGLNCSGCGKEGALNQPDITNGISEKELNVVYNLLDGFIAPITSGGCEFTIVEAMLAGVPTSTVNYSFGETFIDSGLCEPMPFDFYREPNSLFLKAQPKATGIADIMQNIYEQPKKYKEIGLQGREWALDYFNHDKIINKFIDWLDNTSHNYDFKQPEPEKQIQVSDYIQKNDNKKLLVANDGDSTSCFNLLPVLQQLKNTYQDFDIYLSVKPEYFEIFTHLNFIKNLIPFHPNMDNFREVEGAGNHKGFFDVVFHPSALTTKFPSYHHNGLDKVTF